MDTNKEKYLELFLVLLLLSIIIFKLRHIIFPLFFKVYWYFFPSDTFKSKFTVLEGNNNLFIKGKIRSTCSNLSVLAQHCPVRLLSAEVNGFNLYTDNDTFLYINTSKSNSSCSATHCFFQDEALLNNTIHVYGIIKQSLLKESGLFLKFRVSDYVKYLMFRCKNPWSLPGRNLMICSRNWGKGIFIGKKNFEKNKGYINASIRKINLTLKEDSYFLDISGKINSKKSPKILIGVYTRFPAFNLLDHYEEMWIKNGEFGGEIHIDFKDFEKEKILLLMAYTNESFWMRKGSLTRSGNLTFKNIS